MLFWKSKFKSLASRPHLHSFPTRRSSDLDDRSRDGAYGAQNSVSGNHQSCAKKEPYERLQNKVPAQARKRAHALHRSEEHTSELQSPVQFVSRPLLETKHTNLLKDLSKNP